MYQYRRFTLEDITPRALILSMINSVGTRQQSISELVKSAEVFAIEPAAIRVAASRLVKEGILESPERGIYISGGTAKRLTLRLQNWQNALSKVTDWSGDWLANATHHLGRTDRKQLRARERAFSLTGYREAETGLWVRPANLVRSLADHRSDLIALGADDGIITLKISGVSQPAGTDWADLWDRNNLRTSYQTALSDMQTSLKRLPDLPPLEGAREALLIGQSVIRCINVDPLLPDEFGDRALFGEMLNTMKAYNIAGRTCWRKFRQG